MDIEDLQSGRMLNDNHIQLAHKLLSKQFPDMHGLQPPTFGQILGFQVEEPPFVQILHNIGEDTG